MKKGEMLDKALLIATNAHHGQFDKGGNPYILHPLKVMHYLKTDDEELQAIAVLHDVLEDCNVTCDDLYSIGMTHRVILGVKALTKVGGQSRDEYLEAIKNNRDASLVKLQDLRHNTDIRRLKGVTQKDIERVQKYHEMYLEIKQNLENKYGE